MTTMATDRVWDTDQTLLCERLAERLHHQGVAHPVAAAVALAVRGDLGCDRRGFAARLGLDPAVVEAADAGQVALADLPAPIVLAARHAIHLDLDRLAVIAQRYEHTPAG